MIICVYPHSTCSSTLFLSHVSQTGNNNKKEQPGEETRDEAATLSTGSLLPRLSFRPYTRWLFTTLSFSLHSTAFKYTFLTFISYRSCFLFFIYPSFFLLSFHTSSYRSIIQYPYFTWLCRKKDKGKAMFKSLERNFLEQFLNFWSDMFGKFFSNQQPYWCLLLTTNIHVFDWFSFFMWNIFSSYPVELCFNLVVFFLILHCCAKWKVICNYIITIFLFPFLLPGLRRAVLLWN